MASESRTTGRSVSAARSISGTDLEANDGDEVEHEDGPESPRVGEDEKQDDDEVDSDNENKTAKRKRKAKKDQDDMLDADGNVRVPELKLLYIGEVRIALPEDAI